MESGCSPKRPETSSASEATSSLKNQGRMSSSVTMQACIWTPPVELQLSAAQPTSCNRQPSSIGQAPYYIHQQNNQQSHGLWNSQSSSQPVSNSSSLQSRQMPQTVFNCFVGQVASLPAAQYWTRTQNFKHLSGHQTLSRNTVPQQNYNVASMNNVSSTTASWFPSNYGNANSTINQINLTDQSVLRLNGQHNGMHITQQTPAQPQLAGLSGQSQAPHLIRSNQGQTSAGHTNSASYSTVNQYPATSQRLFIPSQPSKCHSSHCQSHSSHDGNQVQHSSEIQHQPPPYRMENNAANYCPPPYIGKHFVTQNQNQRINQNAESGLPRDGVQPQTPLQLRNTMQVSGHHSKTSHTTVPDFQGNTQSHVLQLNGTTNRLQMYSQFSISSNTPTSKASPSILRESTLKLSKVTSERLLVAGTQVPSRRHGTSPLSCHKASFTTERQQPSHNSTKGSYSEKPESASYCSAPATLCGKEIQRVSEYQAPVQRTTISKENIPVHNSQLKALCVQSSERLQMNLHTDTNPERENGHKRNNRHGEVQYSEDMAEALELIKALQKVHQQSHKFVAVVPSISQQVPNLENKDVTTNSDDSLPFKIEAVGSLVKESENVEHGSNALNLPKETFKKLQQLFSEPHPETQDCEEHNGSAVSSLITDTRTDIPQSETGSTTPEGADCSNDLTSNTPEDHNNVNTGHSNCSTVYVQQQLFSVQDAETQDYKKTGSTVDGLISDTQSADMPMSNIGSTTSQSPGCSTVLTSRTPEDHSNDKTGQSNCDTDDLSKLEVHTFTLNKFNDLVKVLENEVKIVPVDDVEKCLVELYYEGNKSNMEKQARALTAEMCGLFSSVSVDDAQTAKFQYVHPKDLKTLAHNCHILKNDTISPTEESRSSWLNVDGHPADIENVLAEPILDLNFTDYASEAGFNTLPLNVYSEFEPSTKMIAAVTDNQNVQMINNELASLQVCQSKSIYQTFNAHKLSENSIEKHEDKILEEPKEQNGLLDSETVGTLAENNTECEQACRDDKNAEDISSSPEIIEQSERSNEDNFGNDTELMELSLLSSNDVRTIFNEVPGCNFKKVTSQLCQYETKVSATMELGESNSDNQIKFTCPHVTDIDWDGEHFCPSCWEETPVLNIDLEECQFSPEEGPLTSTQGHQDQNSSPISGNPDSNCNVLSESNSKTASLNLTTDVSKMTVLEPDLNPIVVVDRCTSLSGKSPVKEPHDSLTFTMASEKHVSKTTNSMGLAPPKALSDAQNIENPFISVQTKSPRDDVSPPENRLLKKFRLSKSMKKPVEGDLVTTYMVNEKARSKNSHPGYSSFTPAEDGQDCKKKRKEWGISCISSIKLKPQINSSQSGKTETYMNMYSETRSDSTNPSTCGESPSALCGTSPGKEAHGLVHSESFKFNVPIKEQVCKQTELLRALDLTYNTDKRKPVVPSQTTALRQEKPLPTYPPCKKVKRTRTIPVPNADDLFTPDNMVIKASSPKSHPRVPDVTRTEDGRHPFSKDKRKKGDEKKSKTDAPKKFKTSFVNSKRELCYTKQTGQKKEVKKQRFALCGSKKGNRNRVVLQECSSKTKVYTAPVYTVLDNSEKAPSYTDTVSAKQKIYRQWSSMYVPITKTSSHKKCQKMQ